jgi:serine/threonine-protein kinase SRPK3
MLRYVPEERATAADMLSHPWLAGELLPEDERELAQEEARREAARHGNRDRWEQGRGSGSKHRRSSSRSHSRGGHKHSRCVAAANKQGCRGCGGAGTAAVRGPGVLAGVT